MNMEMAFNCVMSYIRDPKDRCAVSEVCRSLYELESLTREYVTVAFCCSTTPQRLRQRYRNLRSLNVKSKPESIEFQWILKDWEGGVATPWVREIAQSFHCLTSLHFFGMVVVDSDLELLAHARGHALESLKLRKCLGFSTDGLFHIGRWCRKLKTLVLEDSSIKEKDRKWIHELATNNRVLEKLNFHYTHLALVESQDLEVLANNCRDLISVKVDYMDIFHLTGCLELEHLDLYAFTITNATLECIGAHSKNLTDFRLKCDGAINIPLDNGVRALLRGCSRTMRRFSLHLQSGGLTDIGLGYIGRYSPNVTWMLLRKVGESDVGLLEFSRGCPCLQKLEIVDCCFSARALAAAVLQLRSLKCLWYMGQRELVPMTCPFWNIVFNSKSVDIYASQIVAYYSPEGPNTDCPIRIVPLDSKISLSRDLPQIS